MRNTTKPANPTNATKRPKAIRFAALLFWTTPYTNNTIDMTNKSKMRDEMLTFNAPYRALPLGKTAFFHPCHHGRDSSIPNRTTSRLMTSTTHAPTISSEFRLISSIILIIFRASSMLSLKSSTMLPTVLNGSSCSTRLSMTPFFTK